MKIIIDFDAAGLDKEYPEGIVWPKGASVGKLCRNASPEELLEFVRESMDGEAHVITDYFKVESVTDAVEEVPAKPDWSRLRELIFKKTMLRPDDMVELIKEWLGAKQPKTPCPSCGASPGNPHGSCLTCFGSGVAK